MQRTSTFSRGSTQIRIVQSTVGNISRNERLVVEMGRRSAKIAARKGKSDGLKAKVYGRIGKLIIKAAKAGGPNPDMNNELKKALDMARLANVPKEIIERNISRASDAKQGNYEEVVYEAYGPGKIGFLIECLTDNVNRSAGDLRAVMTKTDGKMAEMGSVKFNFQRRGVIRLKAGVTEEAAFDAATEAGAEDIAPVESEEGTTGGGFDVICEVEAYGNVRTALEAAGMAIDAEASGLVYRPTLLVNLDDDDEAFDSNQDMYDRLMALDDVDAVYTTCAGLS